MSLNDLSSPTPTESDLDYAGYDMGGQDQTDQQEGVIGKRVCATATSIHHAHMCAQASDKVLVLLFSVSPSLFLLLYLVLFL
jgi:hypothetical protein